MKDQSCGALKRIDAQLLEAEDVAYDINGYRDAPPGLAYLDWCHGRDVRHRCAEDVARLGLHISFHPGSSILNIAVALMRNSNSKH